MGGADPRAAKEAGKIVTAAIAVDVHDHVAAYPCVAPKPVVVVSAERRRQTILGAEEVDRCRFAVVARNDRRAIASARNA